jgi:hypothetical protein
MPFAPFLKFAMAPANVAGQVRVHGIACPRFSA